MNDVQTEKKFGIGQWWTVDGRQAVVDAVAETSRGTRLIGRVNIQTDETAEALWTAAMWEVNGIHEYMPKRNLLSDQPRPKISRCYWVNIYPSGPGQLRDTWEQALIEASRSEEEEVLCRVQVEIEAHVGDGLR